MELSLLIVAASILPIVVFLGRYYSTLHERISLPYPPGPKPLPLLGNVFDMPDLSAWITFAEWRKSYGDLIHLHVPGIGHYLIINSRKVAIELLEKRAKIYSDRVFTFIEELFDYNTGILPYSDRWRQHRRTFHQSMRPGAVGYFHPIQRQKVQDLLLNLLDTPADFFEHISTLSSNLLFTSMYGLEGTSKERPAWVARRVLDMTAEVLIPGKFILPKLFPFMRYIPPWMLGGQFTRFREESNKLVQEMRDVAFDLALKRMADAGIPSLVGNLVSEHQDDPEEILRIKNMAATSFEAATDTMASSIKTFCLAMTLNPGAQAKAQEEIDLVIGPARLPNFEDRKSLPYVEAVYREVMRWNPALPLGVPHKTTKDDIYNGYYIPRGRVISVTNDLILIDYKGTIVVTNIWAMNHDASIYNNPDAFQPERFLTGSPDAPFTSINNILAFGFGRRVCVGRYVGDDTVWLAIACVLATFKLEKARDEHGKEIEVPGHVGERFFATPKPFSCSITLRSSSAETLINGIPKLG